MSRRSTDQHDTPIDVPPSARMDPGVMLRRLQPASSILTGFRPVLLPSSQVRIAFVRGVAARALEFAILIAAPDRRGTRRAVVRNRFRGEVVDGARWQDDGLLISFRRSREFPRNSVAFTVLNNLQSISAGSLNEHCDVARVPDCRLERSADMADARRMPMTIRAAG